MKMISCSWDITEECNFNCSYCFFNAHRRCPPSHPEKTLLSWHKLFESNGRCRISITGGEPSSIEGFSSFISELSALHDLHITTNLSFDINEFIRITDSGKISLNTTYHPANSHIKEFSSKVIKLRQVGYKCGITYLAHPVQLKEAIHYKEYLVSSGLDMAISLFWGDYSGKEYPASYSEEQLDYIKSLICWPASPWPPSNVEDPFLNHQLESLSPEISFGRSCRAGCDYFSVDCLGNIRRCGQVEEKDLGNIYESRICLMDLPEPCPAEYCRSNENKLF